MRNYRVKDVDAYIASASAEARPTLTELRKIIRAAVPKAEEGISWGVPFYKYHGVLAGFSAFKNHASFGLVTVLQNKDREMLEKKGYKTGSKIIQIKFNQKVPTTTIRRILKAKARMNEVHRR